MAILKTEPYFYLNLNLSINHKNYNIQIGQKKTFFSVLAVRENIQRMSK